MRINETNNSAKSKIGFSQILRSGNFINPADILREAEIREGMKVAHFGSGPGFYVIPAAEFVGPSGRVVAIDIREQAVNEVQTRARMKGLDNVDVFRSDLVTENGSQLPNAWADLLILANILHQSDPVKVMKEAARVVKPESGRVLAVEWELVNIPLGPPVEQRVEPNAVLAAAKANGLVLLRRWKPSSYHYAFLLARAVGE